MTGQTAIHIRNLHKVYRLLADGPLTRFALMKKSDLSLMSMTNLINQLAEEGVVDCYKEETAVKRVGRKARTVILKTEAPVWLIMDLRNASIVCEFFKADRKKAGTKTFDGPDYNRTFSEFLAFLGSAARRFPLRGAAAITPGPYDPKTDRVKNIRIPELNSMPLQKTLSEALGLDCYIEEDVKLSAIACSERFPYMESLYYLYIGTGVGGAFVNKGDVIKGLNLMAGDPGQLLWEGRTFEEQLKTETVLAEAAAGSAEEVIRKKAEVARRLADIILWILDPHVLIIDCAWPGKLRSLFAKETKTLLSENTWRIMPAISIPEGPEQESALGAINIMELRWITQICTKEKQTPRKEQ